MHIIYQKQADVPTMHDHNGAFFAARCAAKNRAIRSNSSGCALRDFRFYRLRAQGLTNVQITMYSVQMLGDIKILDL